MENRAPPPFQADAAATEAPGCSSAPAAGSTGQIRAGPRARGRAEAGWQTLARAGQL